MFHSTNSKSPTVTMRAACFTLTLFLLLAAVAGSRHRSSRLNRTNVEGQEKESARKAKFLSIFQVIRFANDMCEGSGAKTGTCFTEQECSAKGGANIGTCASGFGVCCVVTLNCGETSSENCTYFDSNTAMAGGCQVTICPCNDNICQLRLDFESFVIGGPSTDPAVVTKRVVNSGVVASTSAATGIPVTEATQCLTDTFSVSNADGPNPPTICGVNTGEHMYVESNDCCNDLTFQLGENPIGTTIPNRAWSIKVTQFSCQFNNLAPQGCVQYFFGMNTDNIQTFNFQNGGGVHLANQDQQICIRREQQYCRICYFLDANDQFDVTASGSALNTDSLCCGYRNAVSSVVGFDCFHVPGALNKLNLPNPSNFCGSMKLLTSTSAAAVLVMNTGGSVCSVRTPFTVNFRSDLHETTFEAAAINNGFMLTYLMDANGCDAAAI